MPRRFTFGLVLLAVMALFPGGRRLHADGEPAPAAPAGAEAALGRWVAAASVKLASGGTLHAFVLNIELEAAGYRASARAEITLPMDRSALLLKFTGQRIGDELLFQSTERHRPVDGGEPVALDPVSMRASAKAGRLEVHLGNDKEGYTDLTLVRKVDGEDRLDPERLRGEWGGEMPHKELSAGIILDELYVSVPPEGAWTADVRMECTVVKGEDKIPVTVVAHYAAGRVDGSRVRFAIVPWHRTVTPSGQKDDLEGNPLVLELSDEGALSGLFEGSDGWPFTLRRGAAVGALDALAGSWGGEFKDAKLNDMILIRAGTLELVQAAGGEWGSTVEFTFVVKTTGDDVLVKVAGSYPPGLVKDNAVKFPGTRLTRTVLSTGAQNEMEGNPLEVRREPDGRLEAKFVGEGGFTLTMMRR